MSWKDYVRKVLGEQILLTANREEYEPVAQLSPNHEFFFYQDRMNHDVNAVASHTTISQHQKQYNVDYRAESSQNPVKELQDRTTDNTKIARTTEKPAYV